MVRGLILALAVASPAAAQDGGLISIDLNRVDQVDMACRLTFVAENALGDLAGLALETVVFDAEGKVAALSLFDFADLPQGARRVRQFDVVGQNCAKIAQVLVNGVASCAGDGLDRSACALALRATGSAETVEVLQ